MSEWDNLPDAWIPLPLDDADIRVVIKVVTSYREPLNGVTEEDMNRCVYIMNQVRAGMSVKAGQHVTLKHRPDTSTTVQNTNIFEGALSMTTKLSQLEMDDHESDINDDEGPGYDSLDYVILQTLLIKQI